MYFPRAIVAALTVGAGLFTQSATAHSTERGPLSYVVRVDDAIIHTPAHRVHALSSFDLTFVLHDQRQKIRLSLTPNHDILSEDAVIQHIGPDGEVYAVEPIDRLDHRVFLGNAFVQHPGYAEWTNVGWARIAVHRDGASPVFEGAFRVDGDQHHIQTGQKYRQTTISGDPEVDELGSDEYMVVWRDSDIVGAGAGPGPEVGYHVHDELKRDLSGQGSGQGSCVSDSLLFNRDEDHPVYRSLRARGDESLWFASPSALFGRQLDGTTGGNGAGVNLTSTIGSTAGCPTTRKVALIGVATDCTYTAKFNSTSTLREHIISMINTASQLYESTFNISLGIQNLTISSGSCPSVATTQAPWNVPCSDDVTITDRLNTFSQWRGQSSDTNAFWTLLSTCPTGSAVGLAWLGQLCVQGSQSTQDDGGSNQTIASANVAVWTSTEWQVVAHEAGHTFGAVHDCTATTCTDGSVTKQQCCPLSVDTCNANAAYIMNPSTGSSLNKFSACTVGNICGAMKRNSVQSSCLTNNRNVNTISGSQCGNGIVENDEECDCGGVDGCGDNRCCDPTTCKFTTNAVCDPANEECCTSSCSFASNGTVCRASTGVCDPQEVCTGSSPVCPKDVTSPDGTGCGDSDAGLACASGQCTSRDLQCKTLMGSLTTSNDTYACNSEGCQISCASPEFGTNMCYTMQQNFLDGTSCQGGGHCSNGVCQGTNVGDTITSWINDHPQIFYPVVVIVGILVLAAIISICAACCRRRGRNKRMPKPMDSPPGYTPYGVPAWQAPGPVPMTQQPERVYSQGPDPGGRPEPWGNQRTASTRYA